MERRTALFASLTAPAACGAPQSTGGGEVDASAPVDMSRRLHDFAHDLTPPPSFTVQGVALDETGAPIPMAWMSICTHTACHSVSAAANGAFIIGGISDSPFVDFGVRSHDDVTAMPYQGTVVRLMHPPAKAGMTIDAGMLYVPSMPAGVALAPQMDTPQTVAAGDGLSLTFKRRDLESLVASLDTLAARLIPPAHQPPYDVGAEHVDAIYAIMPYSITSKSPIAVKANLALPAGTEVHFRTVREFEGRLDPVVIGHAAPDGMSVATDPGQGIDNLTWIIVSH